MSDESADKTQPGPYSDKSGTDNTQYGNIAQIRDRLAKAEAAIEQIRQQVAALVERVEQMDGRYQTKLGALEQRLDVFEQGYKATLDTKVEGALALFQQRMEKLAQRINAMETIKTGAWLPEDRYTIYASIASIKARLDAMETMGKVGQ